MIYDPAKLEDIKRLLIRTRDHKVMIRHDKMKEGKLSIYTQNGTQDTIHFYTQCRNYMYFLFDVIAWQDHHLKALLERSQSAEFRLKIIEEKERKETHAAEEDAWVLPAPQDNITQKVYDLAKRIYETDIDADSNVDEDYLGYTEDQMDIIHTCAQAIMKMIEGEPYELPKCVQR